SNRTAGNALRAASRPGCSSTRDRDTRLRTPGKSSGLPTADLDPAEVACAPAGCRDGDRRYRTLAANRPAAEESECFRQQRAHADNHRVTALARRVPRKTTAHGTGVRAPARIRSRCCRSVALETAGAR